LSELPPLQLIVAMTRRRAIGLGGKMPWHVPEDLKRFRKLTTGHAIVMGRKTFESIGRALPDRVSIVVTRSELALPPGVLRCTSVDEALELARTHDPSPFVIGGGEIYEATLSSATHLFVTWVDGVDDAQADTFFPEVDLTAFDVVSTTPGTTPGVTFVDYVRRS
jgi:dihydrofolate reductase